jgi:hypothetical protein
MAGGLTFAHRRNRIDQIACVGFYHAANMIDVARNLGISYIIFLHLQFHDREIAMRGIDVGALTKEMAKARQHAQSYRQALAKQGVFSDCARCCRREF